MPPALVNPCCPETPLRFCAELGVVQVTECTPRFAPSSLRTDTQVRPPRTQTVSGPAQALPKARADGTRCKSRDTHGVPSIHPRIYPGNAEDRHCTL